MSLRHSTFSMNRFLAGALVAALCLLTAGQAWATTTTVTFTPSPSNLTLNEAYYYSWGISFNPAVVGTITSATLSFANITNTVNGTNVLWVNLLDNPALGVTSGTDTSGSADYWTGKGPLIGTYVDNNGTSTKENYSISLSSGLISTLNTYAADGVFGIGFDPDCQYTDSNITLTMTVTPPSAGAGPVPEPATMAGVLMAIGALGTYVRGRFSKR
jgi:hypothetical protein